MKKLFLAIFAVGLSYTLWAQDINLNNTTKPVRRDSSQKPMDGYYRNSDIENRKVIEYAPLRQADVAYRKRIWREIDLREKMNLVFTSPNARLMDIIVNAIQDGSLTAYDPTPTKDNPTGDNFEYMAELPVDQVMARLGGDSVLVEEFNENNEVISSRYENRAFSGENVLKFRIKEDWIFDKQRSIFEPRIIGIAPLITPSIPGMEQVNNDGITNQVAGGDPFDPFSPQENNLTDENIINDIALNQGLSINTSVDATPAFWIYFPEARHVFVNKEVKNRKNIATGLSYDDVFIKRIFTSYIVKQDNPEDLRIKDYIRDDINRLYESDRIKKVMMDWEQDLWSY
ncbi:type IX secretion system ring subunit PorN/GldN [Sphingobacterium rhinopitheci]|uniref:type IX secretion system ring protein PorN/GldN n=1 Tax=Sphingobacterium rhinopitheci TaxID=2781960 RepID=UPI001F51983B|nr:gliding motility protein GldN [Sphingobacterium rhinopitheci]MCI0920431.1 gliding motility protein GldN [Sphingobacterium rhinopitheci]